jgi:PelA/Pel-15E family pectate lyase
MVEDYRGRCHHWIVVAALLAVVQVMPAAEQAESTDAKSKTWQEIHLPCGFYRWEFGKKNHFRANQIVHLADNIMAAQNTDGGWTKNTDFSRISTPKPGGGSTFDNLTTYPQIMYLARVRQQTGLTKYDETIRKGIRYTLNAQNKQSGGWRGADVDAVTFNDDVMANIMTFLNEIVTDDTLYGWLDKNLRSESKTAYGKGLACILACQVTQGKTLTAWGQQHDHRSLKPCWARDYEPPCITACESMGVLRFLMSIDNPPKEVVRSVNAAVTWLEAVKLNRVRVKVPDKSYKRRGHDILILEDLKDPRITANQSWGPPIWARMYRPETNEVLLYDRGKKKLKIFSDMQQERRTGYSWHGIWPKAILEKEYPEWKKKWAPDKK